VRILSPSLIELHAFVAVAETGTFSRAAERLSVTQGAVSRAVLRLEARLGLVLLERHASGARLTAAGRTYCEQVQPALAQLEAAVPTRSGARPARELRVSAISSLNMRWLVSRMPTLHAEHPDLHIVFKPYWKEDDFQRDDVDCWIQTRLTSTSRWPGHVKATYIVGREIVPICHPSLAPLIRTPADVLKFPLLHHSNYPDNWGLWCGTQGFDTRSIRLGPGFDLAAGLIEAAAANLGIAVVQRCLIEHDLAQGRVAVPLDLAVSTNRGYYLCVPRARTETPQLAAFRAWLLAQGRV
jgi:LysR family transcriptional regulator, glycine cleavage system transcriptional activator